MKKMRLFAAGALLGVMAASCASHAPRYSFGPYSDAETFYKKGNYPKAIEKYQEYLTTHPQGNLAATAEYYIAKSYAASGNKDKAREIFKQVLEKFPGTSWAEFSQEQLQMLRDAAQA
jgi:outer membrane protein assembly factor BamD (BamD/ComL family)